MIYTNKYALLAFTFMTLPLAAQPVTKLKPIKSTSVAIPEPSDICYASKSDTFYIVSDNGTLFETDRDGKIIRKTIEKGADFEAVHTDGQNIYAVDETRRNIYIYDSAFKRSRIVNIPFNGGRNRGYEAMTFNPAKNSSVIVTEKNPTTLFELDADFKITNQVDLSKIASDISAATYHNESLWLLSDESMMVIKLNPLTYEVLAKWSLPVINPEGLAFDKDGSLLITCDDMQRIYYFNNPEKN